MGNESVTSQRGRESNRSGRGKEKNRRKAPVEPGSPAALAVFLGAFAMSVVANDAEAEGRMIDPPVRTPGEVRVGGKPVELPDPSVEVPMQLPNSPGTFFPSYDEKRVPLPSQPRKAFLEKPATPDRPEYLQFQVTAERETDPPLTIQIYPEANKSASARNLRVRVVVSGGQTYSYDLAVPDPGSDTFEYNGKKYSKKPIAVTVMIPSGTSQVVVDTTRVKDDGNELSAVVDFAGYEETAPGQSDYPLDRPLPDTAPVPISHAPDIHERPRTFNATVRVNQLPPAAAGAAPKYRVQVTNMQPQIPDLKLNSDNIIVTPVSGQEGFVDITIFSERPEGTASVPVAYRARVDVSRAREFDDLMVQFRLAAPLYRSDIGARGPDTIAMDVALFEQVIPNRLLHAFLPDGPRIPELDLRCQSFWAHPTEGAGGADADTDQYKVRRAVLQCLSADRTRPTAVWEAILPAEDEHLIDSDFEAGAKRARAEAIKAPAAAALEAAEEALRVALEAKETPGEVTRVATDNEAENVRDRVVEAMEPVQEALNSAATMLEAAKNAMADNKDDMTSAAQALIDAVVANDEDKGNEAAGKLIKALKKATEILKLAREAHVAAQSAAEKANAFAQKAGAEFEYREATDAAAEVSKKAVQAAGEAGKLVKAVKALFDAVNEATLAAQSSGKFCFKALKLVAAGGYNDLPAAQFDRNNPQGRPVQCNSAANPSESRIRAWRVNLKRRR